MTSNPSPEEDDNGLRKAFIIGVSDYQDKSLNPLPFCKNDAEEMYKLLTSPKLQFKIAESNKMVGEVKDREMKKAIRDFFRDPGNRAQDTLLFYFAGHGVTDDSGDVFMASSETDSKEPNIGGFPFQWLTNLMNVSFSTRIITILDCCHSGALELATGRGDPNDAAKKAYFKIDDKSNALKQGSGKCLIAASESYQRAYEIAEKNHGIFTYYLLEGLKGKPQYVDDYGNITVDRLSDYVYDAISNLPPEKKPNQMPIRKVEGGGRIILARYPDLARGQEQISQKEDLLRLLIEGKTDDFNKIRRKDTNNLGLGFENLGIYSRLSFYELNLSGKNLSHADMRNLDLNLANLREANLHNVIFLEASLLGAQLEGADLSDAKLSHAKLSHSKLSDADLTNADLTNADLTNAELYGADISRAKLAGANLEGAKLAGAKLSHANLSHAKLAGAKLAGAKLSSASFPHANLTDADLSHANLTDADLYGADLTNANLSSANLSRAKLSHANLFFAKLAGANLEGANLFFAKLAGANLEGAKLSSANLAFSLIVGLKSVDDEKGYPLCENAKFDNAVIDDEKLSSYFHNSNAKSVPPAVKDKKELREKLEERGFNKETINSYLSLSSLPDSAG